MKETITVSRSAGDKKSDIITTVVITLILGILNLVIETVYSDASAILPAKLTVVLLLCLSLLITVIIHFITTTSPENNFVKWMPWIMVMSICLALLYSGLEILIALSIYDIKERLPHIKKTLVSAFFAVTLVIPISYFMITRKKSEKINGSSKDDYSVTGTCITFKLSEDKKNITTYMIKKKSIQKTENPMKNWMFPGGHAFYNQGGEKGSQKYTFDPKSAAVKKMNDEAGISVSIFGLDERNASADTTEAIVNFDLMYTPHYVYLFHQDENAECGHKYHYDCVFVGERTEEINKRADAEYQIASIEINVNSTSKDDIANAIKTGIRTAENGIDIPVSTESYQVYMLFRALNDYITRKMELKEL